MWVEIVENGNHELRRNFNGLMLTIRKTSVPDAWSCELPDGKRITGELGVVRRVMDNFSEPPIVPKYCLAHCRSSFRRLPNGRNPCR